MPCTWERAARTSRRECQRSCSGAVAAAASRVSEPVDGLGSEPAGGAPDRVDCRPALGPGRPRGAGRNGAYSSSDEYGYAVWFDVHLFNAVPQLERAAQHGIRIEGHQDILNQEVRRAPAHDDA